VDLSQTEEYFQKYYNKLTWETLYARAHLKLWERIEKFKDTSYLDESYLDELNTAPHFFTFTIKAQLDDALLTLSRILDKHEESLSIWKFLDFAEQNREIFSTQAFHQRMEQNPNYDESWSKSHKPITNDEINEDRQKLAKLEHVISHIKKWRDKVIAHMDLAVTNKNKIISKEYPLKLQQLQEVIDTLFQILNRYSAAFKSLSFAGEFGGEDDVQFVMDCIRFYIEEHKKQASEKS
jgi:mRNA-degrading endonuclease YafQ of YafQ-DinJ toxin-antitoxin module